MERASKFPSGSNSLQRNFNNLRVILMSTDEKVVRLVEQLKEDFEKYHTCGAFKKQTLADPSDSQRVAQSLSGEIMLVVVLDEALFEILDHKNSRRLLYKIRDISKCGRAVFVKYHGEYMEKIQNFLEEITEEQVRDVQDLTSSNIPTITAQILDLPLVNRRATESDEVTRISTEDGSLEMAAKDLSKGWTNLDKESICNDDYRRRISDIHVTSDPQESHDSLSDSSRSLSSTEEERVRFAQNIPVEERPLTGKLSSKLQVDLPKTDGRKLPCNSESPNTDSYLPNKALPAECLNIPGCKMPETNQSLPYQARGVIQVPQGRQDAGNNMSVGYDRTHSAVNTTSGQRVLSIPVQIGDIHPLQFTQGGHNQTLSQNLPLTSVSHPPLETRPIFSVPTQESCNTQELRTERNLSQCEQGVEYSYLTSYHQINPNSFIRCQKCNQIKDRVKLYSVAPHQTGHASVHSYHYCSTMPNSSGPEAMMFTYSLCLECSEDSPSPDSHFRQNSFCGTNDTIHSSNLFPVHHSESSPALVQPDQPRCASNLEKGFQPQPVAAFSRHESSPELDPQRRNNFNPPPFRQEILCIDQRMRQVPIPHRNIPIQSGSPQPSNSDNTQIRPERSFSSSSQNPGYTRDPSSTKSMTRNCPRSSLPSDIRRRSNGGASSELPNRSFQQSVYDSAAGASAADYDHKPLTELSHVVVNYIQDSLDCCHSSQLNWEQLAHLHGWNFGMINQIKLKWQKRMIESPFLELIQNSQHFQNYTYGQLKEDLEKIPRKDILEKLRDYEEKGKLLVG